MKFLFLAMGLLFASSCIENPQCYERPPAESEEIWILSDHYHARKQNQEDYVLSKSEFRYQGVFGYRRLFNHLARNDYHWGSIRDLPLSKERLEGYDILFINLVSDDRPDFTKKEVALIIGFVEKGGGLFVIADHTNVYHHAERVNRFLIPMGIEVLYSIAVDFPPEHSIAGLGWTLTSTFNDHPIGKDLHQISLQTGGPMVSKGGGVAFTSKKSFADYWDPTDKGGFYGNWTHDGDDALEPKGPLEVVSAVKFGKGRVVVVGDQNMFGDAWLHYVDNFELATNAFEWLANKENTQSHLRHQPVAGTSIGLDQKHTKYFGGKSGADGFFSFYVNSNRDAEITGRGINRFNGSDDVLMLLNPTVKYSDTEIAEIGNYLKDGKTVMLGLDPGRIHAAGEQLLHAFAPDFTLTLGTENISIDKLSEVSFPEIKGSFSLFSTLMNVVNIKLGIYHFDPSKEEHTNPLHEKYVERDIEPYLFDIKSSWGKPFIQANNGPGKIDIARIADVEKGKLIVFVQDTFFRNKSMGNSLVRPKAHNKDIYKLHYRFLDYLKVDRPTPYKPVKSICTLK